MLELRVRRRAQRDLDEIWDYTQQRWSVAQADRYVGQIRDTLTRLQADPALGRVVEHHSAGLRRMNSGSHVIFYLVENDALDIVRVLHQGMSFPQHL